MVLLVCLGGVYNRFVQQRTLCAESWSDVDVELTRRSELIPDLVATVQGYAAHERDLLDRLVQAREAAVAARDAAPAPRGEVEQQVAGFLGQVLARAEAYPDLKASQDFLDLQQQLTLTEDRTAAARRFYDGNVRAYDTRLGTLPSNLVGSAFHFTPEQFFQVTDPGMRAAPGVVGFS